MRAHFGISSLEIGVKTRRWFFIERLKVRFGETPKPTRETRALPGHYAGTSARSRPRLRNELRQCLARIPGQETKFATARAPSPARETRALPRVKKDSRP